MTVRTVVVTGCSSGIGRCTAERLHAAGWRVLFTLRGGGPRAATLGINERERLKVAALDVTNGKERYAVTGSVASEFNGRLDALVLNAGYALFGALEDLSEEQIRAQMETNFLGQALLTQSLLPALRNAKGRVIAVSSVFGSTPFPLTSLYCASKFALEGFVRSLRHELAPHGVSVALVRPGRHRTRFGDNIVWGRGAVSAYSLQTAAYRRLRDALGVRPAANGNRVAAAVERLLACRRMPPMVTIGGDARVMLAIERLIPAVCGDVFFRRLYARIFQSPEPS